MGEDDHIVKNRDEGSKERGNNMNV